MEYIKYIINRKSWGGHTINLYLGENNLKKIIYRYYIMFGNGFWCKEDTLAERLEDEAHRQKIIKLQQDEAHSLKILQAKQKITKDFITIKGVKFLQITNFYKIK